MRVSRSIDLEPGIRVGDRFFLGGVMLQSRVVSGVLLGGLRALVSGVAPAQDYPNKPVRIITAPPGGGGDLVSRLLAQGITGPLGQPVIVDNRPAVLLGEIGAKATPDGYSILVL